MALSKKAMAALSVPGIPMYALMMPLVIFIPPYYAEHMGLGMAAVGTIFTLGRLFDVISDPFAGALMEKTRVYIPKQGWIMLGALPLSLAVWKIFFASPPGDTTILMMWLLVLYAAWTLMSVGLFSWGSEAAGDYHERSVMMGVIQIANLSGTVLVLVIPAVIELFVDTENIQLLRIRAMGAAILLLLPIALTINWFYAPRAKGTVSPTKEPVWAAFKGALANVSFRRLIAADLFVGLISGTQTAIIVFFVEIVLRLDGHAALLQLLALTASLLGVPVFIHLSAKLEKHKTLCIAVCLTACAAILASQMAVESLFLAVFCYILFGFPMGAAQMLPRAIMADVVDEARLKSGDSQTALYFSFLTTTFKLGLGLGVGVTYFLAGLAEFDPATARLDDSAHWVIRAMVGGLPLMFAAIILTLMWHYPLNRRRYEEMRDCS
ncbi:MFS transporter [Maricurvus nonylphenolicus]|uniref:MFS transporter n=1 Tax=Maricurvus nonylphenolicus TaxID=1008307 RepID=UPI0036F4226D